MDFDEKVRLAVTLAAAKIGALTGESPDLKIAEAELIAESFSELEKAIDLCREASDDGPTAIAL